MIHYMTAPKEEKYLEWNEFINALREGKELQYLDSSKWIDSILITECSLSTLMETFNAYKYRIKPAKVRNEIKAWANVYPNKIDCWPNQQKTINAANDNAIAVAVELIGEYYV